MARNDAGSAKEIARLQSAVPPSRCSSILGSRAGRDGSAVVIHVLQLLCSKKTDRIRSCKNSSAQAMRFLVSQAHRPLSPMKYLVVACTALTLLTGTTLGLDIPAKVLVERRLNFETLQDWSLPVYVGTVKESSAAGTVAAPPSSLIDIEQTLRGDALGGAQRVIWTRGASAVTFADRACIDGPFDPKRDCSYILDAASLATQVSPPKVGERLIVVTIKPSSKRLDTTYPGTIPGIVSRLVNENSLAALIAYPATPENLAAFSQSALSREPLLKRFNSHLFVGTLIAAIAAMILAFASPKAGLGIGLLTFLLYALYESGISSNTNIRIDLVFVYPALALAFIAISLAIVRMGKRNTQH